VSKGVWLVVVVVKSNRCLGFPGITANETGGAFGRGGSLAMAAGEPRYQLGSALLRSSQISVLLHCFTHPGTIIYHTFDG
jgi:hypothetical protein